MSRPAGFRFWLVTLATALGIGVTFSLGQWQLSRAGEKQALQAAVQAQRERAPMDTAALARGVTAADLHRPVQLRGRWLPSHTIYMDNRPMKGRPGFYVMTPLQLDGLPDVVLVQRGWAPRHVADRERLPPVTTPEGLVQVSGRLAAPPGRLLELDGGAAPGPGSSAIRQNLDLQSLRAETRLPLLTPLLVRQTGAPSEGLVRDWPEADTGVGKHHGYAFQWFGLSALLATLYVWFQFIAPRRQARRP